MIGPNICFEGIIPYFLSGALVDPNLTAPTVTVRNSGMTGRVALPESLPSLLDVCQCVKTCGIK